MADNWCKLFKHLANSQTVSLSYILWLGVDSSRRCCRMSKAPHFSSFYRLCCFMCCIQGLLTHTAVTCPGKWLVTHLCSHYFIQSPHWCLCAWKGINSRNPILWESVFFFFIDCICILLIVMRFTWLKCFSGLWDFKCFQSFNKLLVYLINTGFRLCIDLLMYCLCIDLVYVL